MRHDKTKKKNTLFSFLFFLTSTDFLFLYHIRNSVSVFIIDLFFPLKILSRGKKKKIYLVTFSLKEKRRFAGLKKERIVDI
jgi:hypothetical protein